MPIGKKRKAVSGIEWEKLTVGITGIVTETTEPQIKRATGRY